jgi:two-component sensor histidine kinase
LRLVRALARQLSGALAWRGEAGGTTVTLTFPGEAGGERLPDAVVPA